MSKVIVDIGMSLDGFVAGPNAGPHNPLGDGGTLIHQWLYSLETWRERQSLAGGETNPDDEVVKEAYARVGAYTSRAGRIASTTSTRAASTDCSR